MEHNPDFEVDWIRERQKACDLLVQTAIEGPAPPPSISFEGIPLQLNLLGKSRTNSESNKPKKSKKSSSKKDKKASKKKDSKKRGSSSSSTSSSDSDDSSSSSSSDVEAERLKTMAAMKSKESSEPRQSQSSIRNQMRKMDSQPVSSSGYTNNGSQREDRNKYRDSDYEQDRRRRRRSPDSDIGKSRSPVFDNRYRDKGRNRSKDRQYRRRDSRSRSPAYRRSRRTRSRSRSRSPRRIEKAVVNYPPQFKPRVAEKKAVEKRRTPPPKKPSTSAANSSTVPGKKLPFIGRMPVFKKQASGSVDDQTNKLEKRTDADAEQQLPTPVEETSKTAPVSSEPMPEEVEDELMPDPEQMKRMMHDDAQRTMQQEQDDMLPPGIDECESHLAPKAINDAPVPRRGPLPRDLEDALNIIFPGEKPKDPLGERKPFVVTGHIKDNGTEIITGPEPDDEVSQNTAAMFQVLAAYQQQQQMEELPLMVPPPPEVNVEGSVGGEEVAPEQQETGEGESVVMPADVPPPPATTMDMDELAMLGIDANDLAAQCV